MTDRILKIIDAEFDLLAAKLDPTRQYSANRVLELFMLTEGKITQRIAKKQKEENHG